MSSQNPTYDAGQDRGVLPIGVWSTSNTRVTWSVPVICLQPFSCETAAPVFRALPTKSFKLSCNTCLTSVLLPLPLTPDTQTSWPNGIFTHASFRLCRFAPTISNL